MTIPPRLARESSRETTRNASIPLVDLDSAKSSDDFTVEEHARWCRAVEKAVSNLRKKERSLEKELEKVSQVDAIKKRADLLSSHLYLFKDGVTTATVFDWETNAEVSLTLDDEYDSASDEVEGLYKQLKKYQRGSQKIEEQLEQARKNLDSINGLQSHLEGCRDDDAVDGDMFGLLQEKLLQTSQSTRFVPPKPPLQQHETMSTPHKEPSRRPVLGTPASNVRKLQSPRGCTVLVGRNKRGNEYLSCTYGKADDIWMHARGAAGAHVLLLQRRGSPTAQEDDVQLAMDVAAFYSDARTEQKVPVTITSPKHITKPKRAPLGAVLLRQELRTGIGNPDNVPEHLKEQRAKSGRSDEYRQQDKGKLRKQGQKHQ